MSEATQLAPRQHNLPTIEPSRGMTPMDLIHSMIQHGVDAEQLDKMLTLQERWEANEARKAFAAAMADFQARCPRIKKKGKAKVRMKSGGEYGYTFPQLDDIMQTIQPHLESCGLSIAFTDFTIKERMLSLACIVRHKAGHSEAFPFSVPVDQTLQINDMQKVGVANSYCRRYALCNALSLVGTDSDTDGNLPPATRDTITDKQAVTLREWMETTEANEAAFCQHFHVESVDDLPARQFNTAMNMLKQKRKQMEAAE